MAKRSRARASTQIVRVPMRAPTPIIRVSAPRSAPHKKRRGGRRRGGSGGSGYTQKAIMASLVGGAVLGFVDKSFGAQIPTIPMIGRKGTIAVLAYFIGKNMRMHMAFDVAKVAAGIAGYELATAGHISGDDVSGLAAQV